MESKHAPIEFLQRVQELREKFIMQMGKEPEHLVLGGAYLREAKRWAVELVGKKGKDLKGAMIMYMVVAETTGDVFKVC